MIADYQNLVWSSLSSTISDILPILLVLAFFQVVILRRGIPHFRRVLWGTFMVTVGLAVFVVGLKECIFPLGTAMIDQLTDPAFLTGAEETESAPYAARLSPRFYVWTIAFAFCIGFSTALAEPTLIAVALKAHEISTGAISTWGLRTAVALGAGLGAALGTYRILVGTPLPFYIIVGYVVLLIQTHFAPKFIVPLAYDLGGVTTSTVTVPLLVALGLGLASRVPGASPLLDGFGLIAFAALFPMITVLAYAMICRALASDGGGNVSP